MSRKDQIDDAIDATGDQMDAAEERLREKYGMSHVKATAIDCVVIVGCIVLIYIMYLVDNIVAWFTIALATYFVLLSLAALRDRYFGGNS